MCRMAEEGQKSKATVRERGAQGGRMGDFPIWWGLRSCIASSVTFIVTTIMHEVDDQVVVC